MAPPSKTLRIATRSSELALWQANHVADLLRRQVPQLMIELVDVSTQGDRDQTQPLREMGGTGVFTREVQRAVLEGHADVAVHSLKDLPTEVIEPDLHLAAVPVRALRWDALVLPASHRRLVENENPLDCLPEGARIGSGSLRRQAQLRAARPDLQMLEIRGNLNTRLRKLDTGEYDALILAAAGLIRLNWEERLSSLLRPPIMFPAVSQGALGLECRTNDLETRQHLEVLTHLPTLLTTIAERALLATLRAGCHAPVGVQCDLKEGELQMIGVVLSRDGQQQLQSTFSLPLDLDQQDQSQNQEQLKETAYRVGQKTAEQLLSAGAKALMEQE